MKCNYTVKKQDVKKYLRKKHQKINILCILLFSILFILMNFNVFINNPGFIMMILGCTLVIVGVLIFIVNRLYILASIHHMENDHLTFGTHTLVVDQKHIEDVINKHKLSILWKNVEKIKITEERIMIKPKEGHTNLVLEKKMMNHHDFDSLVQKIRKYQ